MCILSGGFGEGPMKCGLARWLAGCVQCQLSQLARDLDLALGCDGWAWQSRYAWLSRRAMTTG